VPIGADTKNQVLASIEQTIASAWRPYLQAARYLLENGGDVDKALGYIDRSIAVSSNWQNNMVRAQILAKKGQKAEAHTAALHAQKLGAGERNYEDFGKDQVAKVVAETK